MRLVKKVNFWYTGSLDPVYSSGQHSPSATVAGLMAHGYEINHVAQNGFRESEWMDCDLCVIYGMRTFGKQIIAEHEKRGVQCISIDLGYMKRAMRSNGYEGYWQVSKGGLNWLPYEAPDDRWKALELDYPKAKKGGDYILLAEQTPNDSSHEMDLPALNKWMQDAVDKCEALGLPYKKRRHPMNRHVDPSELPDCPIEDDLANAFAVYCHNSNVGNDALLMGLPVVCDKNPVYQPTYKDMANKEIKPELSYPDGIEDYLHRLAYAQWSRDEIANGKAFEYVIEM